MNNLKALSWDWSENAIPEQALKTRAREIGIDMGANPCSPATGAALRMLATISGAKAIIELGTGVGVSGLYLLEGMSSGGVLTTIDSEAEFLRVARTVFKTAKNEHLGAPRIINEKALEILPRMAKAAYDMVVLDADEQELATYIEQVVPRLRPGGIIAIPHALWKDQVGDPARRDQATVAMRSVITALLEDERFITNVLTCGDGLAVAVLR